MVSVGEFVSSVTDALLRMFRDAADSAHYTTDYTMDYTTYYT